MSMAVAWPEKSKEMHNQHIDSTFWNDFKFRDDDIVISTYAKSGTTWMQQIISQMLFNGETDLDTQGMSPWIDFRVPPKEIKLAAVEAQTHRRFVKTHLPVEALVYSPKAKYLYIGRDGRDVLWSLYNHHARANQLWYDVLNLTPGLVGDPIERPDQDINRYFRTWLDENGKPFWPYWENIRTWWAARTLPNVKLVHFADLKADMEGQMRSIADFLGCEIDAAQWPAILTHCSFEWMKANAERMSPLGGAIFEGGAQDFINKGTNGRWKDVLTAEEIEAYESKAVDELGPECAAWLKSGTLAKA